MSGIKRLVQRSGHSPTNKNGTASMFSLRSSTNEALGEQLASLLGVRLVLEVEENEYFRDKIFQMSTFGLGGKRGVSDSFNLAETQVGTVWKPRILMVTMSSVLLFGVKKNGAPEVDASDLLNKAEELKTSISMEDISFASQFTEQKTAGDSIVQIRVTQVTGAVRTTLIRCKSNEDLSKLMDVLEVAIRSYRSAIDYLKEGLINEHSASPEGSMFSLVALTQVSPTGNEVILKAGPSWGEEFTMQSLSPTTPAFVYLASPTKVLYRAKIVPYQIKLCAKGEAQAQKEGEVEEDPAKAQGPCIKASPLNPDSGLKPITVYIKAQLVNRTQATSVEVRLQELKDSHAGLERQLQFAIKESSIVAIVSTCVVLFLLLPEWCFQRHSVLTFLALPVALVMLAVRAKQGHRAPLASTEESAQQSTESPDALACRVSFLTAMDGLDERAMDPDSSMDEYKKQHSISSRLSALAAAGAMGSSTRNLSASSDKSQELKGIDALIFALQGAFDETLQDSDCPPKWYDATDGNEKDAIRQWRESLQWRRENNIDTVLSRPLSKFFTIKKLFPHAWLGIDNDGHLVTVEQFGHVKKNVADMKAAGITPEDFAEHCVFLNEFWIKNRLTKTGRLNKIVDLKGFGVSQLSKEVINFFQPMNHAMQQYPELLIKVHIINAPSSFRFAWKIVSGFLAKKTTEKISVVSGNEKTISDLLTANIPRDILLPEYGGTMSGEFRNIPIEMETAAYIRRLNRNCGADSPNDWAPNADVVDAIPLATAVPGQEMEEEKEVPDGGSQQDDSFLEYLVGDWIIDPTKSESMDPVLELQGISRMKRMAAKAFRPEQSIQITGMDTKEIHVTTKTGPVTITAKGEINGNPGIGGNSEKDNDQETVLIRTVNTPKDLLEAADDRSVQILFTLSNGDSRIVHHSIHAKNRDVKLMCIKYIRKSDGKSAIVKMVHNRKKP